MKTYIQECISTIPSVFLFSTQSFGYKFCSNYQCPHNFLIPQILISPEENAHLAANYRSKFPDFKQALFSGYSIALSLFTLQVVTEIFETPKSINVLSLV